MDAIPQVPAALFRGITATLEKFGESAGRIVERAGSPMWQLQPPYTKIPAFHFLSLFGNSAKALGDETFGVLVAEQFPLRSLGSLGQSICGSLTVYDSIKTALELVPSFQNTSRFCIAESENEIWWFRQANEAASDGELQNEISTIRYMIDAVRANAGSNWKPDKVCLQARSIPRLQNLDVFSKSKISYGRQAGGFAIPKSHLSRQMNTDVGVMKDGLLEDPPSNEFVGSLRQILCSLLEVSDLRIETVAEIMGLQVRTLQRRLTAQGLTFKTLVDQTRYQICLNLVADPEISLVEIAHCLHYSDHAHFTRAFRRWAGVSPSEYRRNSLVGER